MMKCGLQMKGKLDESRGIGLGPGLVSGDTSVLTIPRLYVEP
jgi:hypothetical protein